MMLLLSWPANWLGIVRKQTGWTILQSLSIHPSNLRLIVPNLEALTWHCALAGVIERKKHLHRISVFHAMFYDVEVMVEKTPESCFALRVEG
jgi:hypothetical protein